MLSFRYLFAGRYWIHENIVLNWHQNKETEILRFQCSQEIFSMWRTVEKLVGHYCIKTQKISIEDFTKTSINRRRHCVFVDL